MFERNLLHQRFLAELVAPRGKRVATGTRQRRDSTGPAGETPAFHLRRALRGGALASGRLNVQASSLRARETRQEHCVFNLVANAAQSEAERRRLAAVALAPPARSAVYDGLTFRHHACKSVLRLADMSRVRGMYFFDIQSAGSVRARIPAAFAVTSASELSAKIEFMIG